MRTLVPMRLRWPLLLAFAISSAAFGADARGEAAAGQATVASTNGWLSGFRINWPGETNAAELLSAMRTNPVSLATPLFGMAAWDASGSLEQLGGEERKLKAARMVPLLREAIAILDAAARANPGDTNLPVFRQVLQPCLPLFLFELGTNHFAEAGALARQALAENTSMPPGLGGATALLLNELLGRMALRQGKAEEARACLRAEGKAAASLASGFAADEAAQGLLVGKFSHLILARELLEHGDQQDRGAVLAFLDDLARWIKPGQVDPKAQRFAADQLKQLEEWRRQIRDGKIPSDPK